MSTNIEDALHRLPRFSPPVAFKDDLQQQLTAEASQSSRPVVVWPRLAIILAAIAVLTIGMQQLTGKYNPFKPQTVSAAEIIQTFMQTYLKPGSILHRAYYIYEGSKQDYQPGKGIYREQWNDQVCGMFYQEIVESGKPTNIQGSDMQQTYHLDAAAHTIQLFPGDRSHMCQEGQTIEVDLAARLNELLADHTLVATEGNLNGQKVYFIQDYRNTDDKYWDTYAFDYDTKKLVATIKEKDGFYSHIDYQFFETMERNPDTLAAFNYPPKEVNLADYTIQRQVTDPKTGNYEWETLSNPLPLTSPIPSPFPTSQSNLRIYQNTENGFSFMYPNNYSENTSEMNNDPHYPQYASLSLADSKIQIRALSNIDIYADASLETIVERELNDGNAVYTPIPGRLSDYDSKMIAFTRFPEGRYIAFIKHPQRNYILQLIFTGISSESAAEIVQSIKF